MPGNHRTKILGTCIRRFHANTCVCIWIHRMWISRLFVAINCPIRLWRWDFNQVWPSDYLWRHKTRSTLPRVWQHQAITWNNFDLYGSGTYTWGIFHRKCLRRVSLIWIENYQFKIKPASTEHGITNTTRWVFVTSLCLFILTSSNRTFSALLALCEGNSPVTRRNPLSKASDAELWCFLWSAPEQTVNRNAGDLRCHCAHYDVTAMYITYRSMYLVMGSIKCICV